VALLRHSEDLWGEQEVVALRTAAAALSNTLARERLFDQVQRTLSETEALFRGSAALSEASSYRAVLDVLLAHTVLGQDAQFAALHLFDRAWTPDAVPEYSEIVAHWSATAPDDFPSRYRVARFGASARLMRDGTPLFIENLARDTLLGRRAKALFSRVRGAGSVVIVPLSVGGQRIGFVHADYSKPQVFSDASRRRMVSLAQQASIATLNIRQLRATEARVRREQLIRQISARIQEAPDVDTVLRTAVRELGRAFGTSSNRISLHLPGETDEPFLSVDQDGDDQGDAA
jgi:GAF domain-containing protein